MQGYLSIFTKSIVLFLLIALFFSSAKKISELKYDLINIMEKEMEYKHNVVLKNIDEIKEQIEASCINNKQYTRKYFIKEKIVINGKEICNERECEELPKNFQKKEIKRGEHYITIECNGGKIYD